MKKSELQNIIKEEIKSILLEKPEKIDYTDRNQGFKRNVDRLEKLKNEVKNLDFKKLADQKMIEYKYYRLGPSAADDGAALDRIFDLIRFLKQDNSKKY